MSSDVSDVTAVSASPTAVAPSGPRSLPLVRGGVRLTRRGGISESDPRCWKNKMHKLGVNLGPAFRERSSICGAAARRRQA